MNNMLLYVVKLIVHFAILDQEITLIFLFDYKKSFHLYVLKFSSC